MGGKYKLILPKNMLSSSLVDIIFLLTFLLLYNLSLKLVTTNKRKLRTF